MHNERRQLLLGYTVSLILKRVGRGWFKDMATITRQEIIEALERLGQLAVARETEVELALVGGALMVLLYEARESTRDVDVVILAPREVQAVRELAQVRRFVGVFVW